jgi:hypothetical protein
VTGVVRECIGHGYFTDLQLSDEAPHATIPNYLVD